jgi:hypothetical protein
MGEIFFDSFISSPQSSVTERRQFFPDRHPMQARQAELLEQFPCVWQADITGRTA